MISATLAVNGAGYTAIDFHKGKLLAFHAAIKLTEGQIRIYGFTPLCVGDCVDNWPRLDIEEAAGDEFLSFTFIVGGNSQAWFQPDGYSRVVVDRGFRRMEVSYVRTSRGIFEPDVTVKELDFQELEMFAK